MRWGVIIVVAAAFAAVLLAATPAAAQDGEQSDSAASTVRIQARLVQSGKVEFGLQLDGDRVWLPQARLFPYSTAEVGRWLFSSPYTLSDSTVVRIQARLVQSGKVEFGLQLDGDRVWLPQARLFPYSTAEVGRWLFSSPYTVDSTGETYCPDGPTHDGERWCAPPPSGDTIQVFSDWGVGYAEVPITRCGGIGYEAEPYYDSGHTWDEHSRVCRTLPLTLRVGTIIEDYDTNGRQYAVHRVTGIGSEPWERLPAWTDVVYPRLSLFAMVGDLPRL